MAFAEVSVDPNALRFSQDSIAADMRSPSGENVPLEEILKKLESGELHPNAFPALEVFRHEDGVLWSKDNKRLWLFRKAGISEITVKLFSRPLSTVQRKTERDRSLMSEPDFFPRIRGQPRESASLSTPPMDNDTEALTRAEVNVNSIATSFSTNYAAQDLPSPRIDRNQYLMPKWDIRYGGLVQLQERASTWRDKIRTDDVIVLLVGGAVTASAIGMGYAGWKLSALVGCAGWTLYKQLRE